MRGLLALIGALVLAAVPRWATAQELLRNAGFEEGLAGWQVNAPSVESAASSARTGSHGARLVAASARPATAAQSLEVGALGGQVLEVRAHVAPQEPGATTPVPNLWVRYVHPRTGRPVFIPASRPNTRAAPWQTLRLFVYVPQGLGKLTVAVSNGSTTPLSVDDVSVTPHAAHDVSSPQAARKASKVLAAGLAAIQAHALHAASVNWPAIEAAAIDMQADASLGFDEAQALQFALTSLGDGHSHRIPPAAPGSASAARPTADVQRVPIGRVAYLPIPGFDGMDAEAESRFALQVRELILDPSAQPAPCGWILDLRNNGGGNMYPMLTGLWPLLGDGRLGDFVYATQRTEWGMEQGRLLGRGPQLPADGTKPGSSLSDTPVALLIGPRTASSGEIVAVAFRGRASVRTFGERTAGLVSANRPIPLPDGSVLALTVAEISDRNGNLYPHGIDPEVRTRGTPAGSIGSDEGVREASAWLEQTCR